MGSPFLRVGYKMKGWIKEIIKKDFGDVSEAKGLYNIMKLYIKYVPYEAKDEIKRKDKLRRLTRWT